MEGEDIIKRIPTGIPGLDEMVCGGFEKNSTILVVGGCGSGKSTFGLQYLHNGAINYGENGIYITFEENKEKIKRHMLVFGWDLDKLEREGKIRILRIIPEDVIKLIREKYGDIVNAVKEVNARRIVIDSITSIEAMIEDEFERKQSILKLIEWLQKEKCTTILTSESEETISMYSRHGTVEFLVDAVVVLYNIQKGNVRESAIEVLKMRGTRHQKKIVPFRIDKGIEVFPQEQVFE